MVMLNELKQIMKEHKMVAVYGDDSDYFFTGYIQSVDESGLLLSKQNHGGYNNGFIFFTEISHFETDSVDTNRHERLYVLRGITPSVLETDSSDNLFDGLLKTCCEKKLCCNILKNPNDDTDKLGFITEIHKNHIVFECITIYGEYTATAYISKSDIFRIFVEGEYEETARMLYENRN